MTYKIKLPEFEGPFDLLLFFIERDELDIYDIPIATITKDFLAYIAHLERLNLDVASEFVLVAATLMHIKAKMLLPRPELDEDGNAIDPRQELVDRLLEYKRYKSVLEDLQYLEQQRLARAERGNLATELHTLANQVMADAELENLTLFRLLRAYEQVLARFKEANLRIVHTVVRFNYSMEERHEFIQQFMQNRSHATFQELFASCENRLHAIYTFLALLELVQQERVGLSMGADINDFELVQIDKQQLLIV